MQVIYLQKCTNYTFSTLIIFLLLTAAIFVCSESA